MKQLHVVQSIALSSGGLGFAALHFAKELNRFGVDVMLLTLDSSGSRIHLVSDAHPIKALAPRCSGYIECILFLSRCISSHKPDVIHLHGAWTIGLAVACWLARRNNISIVISPHGCLELWALSHKKWKKRLALFFYQKWVFNSADLLFATAKQELLSIRALGINSPIAVIPIGIDLPEIPTYKSYEERNFLFLSRIHPVKGLFNLISAWVRIRRSGWTIIIAGPDDGGHLEEVKAKIESLGISGDFKFPGLLYGEKKDEAFLNASVFILPTFSENFGIVIAESLAHAVPVITTTGAPWVELIERDCGWWINPTIDDIASAIESAMDMSPKVLKSMGNRGRELIRQKYSWERIAGSAFEAYEWLIYPDSIKPPFIEQVAKNKGGC